jgi:hypothetical protein
VKCVPCRFWYAHIQCPSPPRIGQNLLWIWLKVDLPLSLIRPSSPPPPRTKASSCMQLGASSRRRLKWTPRCFVAAVVHASGRACASSEFWSQLLLASGRACASSKLRSQPQFSTWHLKLCDSSSRWYLDTHLCIAVTHISQAPNSFLMCLTVSLQAVIRSTNNFAKTKSHLELTMKFSQL